MTLDGRSARCAERLASLASRSRLVSHLGAMRRAASESRLPVETRVPSGVRCAERLASLASRSRLVSHLGRDAPSGWRVSPFRARVVLQYRTRAHSSAGRAFGSHPRGRRFEPCCAQRERRRLHLLTPSPFLRLLHGWPKSSASSRMCASLLALPLGDASSSAGRAFGSHPRGRRFEPCCAHRRGAGTQPAAFVC